MMNDRAYIPGRTGTAINYALLTRSTHTLCISILLFLLKNAPALQMSAVLWFKSLIRKGRLHISAGGKERRTSRVLRMSRLH